MFSDRNKKSAIFCSKWQVSFTIVMGYLIIAVSGVDQDNMKHVVTMQFNTITDTYIYITANIKLCIL